VVFKHLKGRFVYLCREDGRGILKIQSGVIAPHKTSMTPILPLYAPITHVHR